MVQTLLFVSGLNTLFQTFFGTRLPIVIGGSYTFVLPTISIILAGRYSDIVDPHEVFLNFSNIYLELILILYPYSDFISCCIYTFLILHFEFQKFVKIMRGTQGAFIVASTLQIIIGFSGLWRNVTRFVHVAYLLL